LRKRPSFASASSRWRAASPGFLLLLQAGPPARILRGQGLEFGTGVGPQQIGGQLLGIEAQGEVQGVGDDVLGQIETEVEDVVASDPAGFGAVFAFCRLLAGGAFGQLVEMFGVEQFGGRPIDTVAQEGRTSCEETHEPLSVARAGDKGF